MPKPIAYQVYQEIADLYSELVPDKDYNAHYDRPAILSLLPDVTGQNIFDAGCGPGIYAEILLSKSAMVTGMDVSERMIVNAVKRNGNKGRFFAGNLEKPLKQLSDNEFDGILSALAVTYVEDLSKLFLEFSRVLKKDGWFVFSTEHPFFSYGYFQLENYFETQPVSCMWRGFGEKKIEMHCYHHSMGNICEALSGAGFVIERILEAKPAPGFQERDPDGYEKRMKFPSFIHFRARKI